MHQPFDRISAEMVTVLLDIIDGAPRRSVTLPADLVIRASTDVTVSGSVFRLAA
jgi:DNA-binding LacI/PurR family transcriptional regulator